MFYILLQYLLQSDGLDGNAAPFLLDKTGNAF